MKYFNDRDLENTYGYAVRVMISAPVIVKPGERFSARIALLNAGGYPDFNYEGDLLVLGGEGISGLPGKISFSRGMEANLRIDGLSIAGEGVHTFSIRKSTENRFPAGNSNPIWCTSDFPYKLYLGDLHVHSEYGKCGTPFLPKSPDFGYWYARYIAGHDFCSITDHASSTDPGDWEKTKKAAEKWYEPGRFASILGYEGDYNGEDGGHFNIYYPGAEGEMRNFQTRAGGTLQKIFDFARETGAIAIGHHSGRNVRGRNYSISRFGGQDAEPCAEVISQWGSSETRDSTRPIRVFGHPDENHYYDYAIKKGYRLGALGGSDSHTTTPGGFAPMIYPQFGGKSAYEYRGAVTGVFAEYLDRESIFDAIRKRRCFATANERAFIWVGSDGIGMGEEGFSHKDSVEVRVLAPVPGIRQVHLIRNGERHMVFGRFGIDDGFSGDECVFNKTIDNGPLTAPVCYYVKAILHDGDIIISSPVWLSPEKTERIE